MNANQLAVYQQLTQAANLGGTAPSQPVSLPVSVVQSSAPNAPPVVPPSGGPSQPYRYDRYDSGHRESSHDKHNAPERPRDRNDYHDDRRDVRGGFRGGYRGHGRGRWDDRSRYNDKSRDREWTPPPRGRRSRSRSPPSRFVDRRDVKAYNPPQRPPAPQAPRGRFPLETNASVAPENGKDEFGRDLRTASPRVADMPSAFRHVAGSESPLTPLSASVTTSDHVTSTQSPTPTHSTPPAQTTVTSTPTNVTPTATATVTATSDSQVGLDTFDHSTFDPATPAYWDALGKAWAVTHGYLPSQTELMEYTISNGLMGVLPVTSQFGIPQGQWPGNDHNWTGQYQHQSQANRGTWFGGGNFVNGRGRGHGYGNSRNADYMGARGYEGQDTDAQILASGDESSTKYGTGYSDNTSWSYPNQNVNEHNIEPQDENVGIEQDATGGGSGGSVGSSGRMQRVGDKWVFVRPDA